MRLALAWCNFNEWNFPAEHVLNLLKQGHVFKFVLMLMVDMQTFEIVLVIAVGSQGEHSHVAISLHNNENIKNLRAVEMGEKLGGGGKIRIDGSTLILFSTSGGLGPYRQDFIDKIGPGAFKELFKVTDVKFTHEENV